MIGLTNIYLISHAPEYCSGRNVNPEGETAVSSWRVCTALKCRSGVSSEKIDVTYSGCAPQKLNPLPVQAQPKTVSAERERVYDLQS